MAKAGEEEVEYESDPEEEKRLMGMRRRKAASDDEEGEGDEKPRMDRRVPMHSDESDGQGGAAEYDDEYNEDLDGEGDEEEVEEEEDVYDEEEEEIDGIEEGKARNQERRSEAGSGVDVMEKNADARNMEGSLDGKVAANQEEEEDEKKENQPFAVPTAGAFYMHDDRFRDNASGRHRRTYGGRKLWESKDNRKWGHDKFEEMTLQERHYEPGRKTSRGRYRARGGKNQGTDNGYPRRSRSKAFSNGNYQNQAPKGLRGRGLRKYEPTMKNSGQTPPTQNKQPVKSLDKTPHSSSAKVYAPTSNAESNQVPPDRKHSSLSSASPPFYPSGSSNKELTLAQKRDIQTGNTSRNIRTSVADESYPVQQTSAFMRGKNVADSVGIDKLYIDDSVTRPGGRPLNNMQVPSASSLANTMHSSQSRAQGRNVAVSGQMAYQPTSSQNQINRVSPATQLHAAQRSNAQTHIQPSVQAPGQPVGQHSRSGNKSQASSPPKTALSANSYDSGDVETTLESSKSRTALVGKGKGNIQGSGRGSFLYGGAQVMGATGNMGVGHGDQNFPAFLPVMQFGGQHPGGIGVPAVGMAFPGYVAQPQLGLGNSEMTWLPVLAGAAGGLGPTYCSPYIAVDSAYHTRSSGQASSVSSSSNENNTSKPNSDWKPAQTPELASDEFGQRQKPRRYSEMDFKQPSTST